MTLEQINLGEPYTYERWVGSYGFHQVLVVEAVGKGKRRVKVKIPQTAQSGGGFRFAYVSPDHLHN